MLVIPLVCNLSVMMYADARAEADFFFFFLTFFIFSFFFFLTDLLYLFLFVLHRSETKVMLRRVKLICGKHGKCHYFEKCDRPVDNVSNLMSAGLYGR